MRIAVLFYGRILHFDKRFLLKKLDSSHNIDIFYSCDAEPDNLVDDFIYLYEPVAVNNEKIHCSLDLNSYYANTRGVNVYNMIRHFINLSRVFQLLENHISNTGTAYDIVIATRLDLQISRLELIQPEKNTIYIPYGEDNCGLNDRFAMGDIDTMRNYTNIFNNILFLLDNDLAILHPEMLTLAHIKHSNINIKRLYMLYILYERDVIWGGK